MTGLINLNYSLFTSGFTSHFGVALRFSGEMLREISKSVKEKRKKKQTSNFDFIVECGIQSGSPPYKGAHHTDDSHILSSFYHIFA